MNKLLIICYFALLNVSCSHMGHNKQRSPASESTDLACSAILSNLITYGTPQFYTLKDFPELSFDFLANEPKLQKLVALHDLKENRDQAKIILALLKKNSPEHTPEELAQNYLRLLKSCG